MSRVRLATLHDWPEMHRIRMAVRENILSRPEAITQADYERAITDLGRGWVAEDGDGRMAGFAIAYRTGEIWAMFVDPEKEGRGHARALHAEMVRWLRGMGLRQAYLSTDPGTRAEAFYRRQGWEPGELRSNGELAFELALDCLVTPASRMRPCRAADLPHYLAMNADPQVRLHIGGLVSREQATSRFKAILAGEPHGLRAWSVIRATTGEYAGLAWLAPSQGGTEVELGFVLARAHWGRGIATEVASALVQYARSEMPSLALVATVDPDHAASIRVLEKSGMRLLRTCTDGDGPFLVFGDLRA